MVLPVIKVEVEADTAAATRDISEFSDALEDIPSSARAATRSTTGVTSAFNKSGASALLASNRTRQVTQQLSQVAQQSVATGNVVQAFAIQAADIGLAFGTVGTIVGALAGIGIPLLATAFSELAGSASNAADQIDEIDRISSDAKDTIDILSLSVEELARQYGVAADRVVRFARESAALQAAQATSRFEDQSSVLRGLVQDYTSVSESSRLYETRLNNLASSFGITHREARALQSEFDAFVDAGDFSEQQESLDSILGLLEEMDVPLGEIPEDIQDAILEMINLSNQTDRARALMNDLAAAAAGVSTQFTTSFPSLLGPTGEPVLPSLSDLDEDDDGRGRGGRRDSRSDIEALVRQLQTEQELVEQFREDGLESLQRATEAELEALGGFNEAKLRLEEEYQERLRNIKQRGADSDLSIALGSGQEVLTALGSFNDKALRVAKVFGAAQALVSTYQGAAEALKLPFPANLAAAASVISTGLGFVSAIRGATSSGGGGGAGAGAGGGAGGVPAAAAQSPLNVRLSGISPTDLISGAMLGSLLDRLQDEAGDRGYSLSVAT